MPTFTYKARVKGGKGIVEGEIDAVNKNQAAATLVQSGRYPSLIEERKAGSEIPFIKEFKQRMDAVKLDELILFTSQLETLFRAGIPLVGTFEGLIEQTENERFKTILTEIKSKVEDGATLHESMAAYPYLFSETYTSMVMAGEMSGTLDQSLRNLSEILERSYETENRIKEVTRYPKIVVGSVMMAVTVLMSFVVPRFMKIFAKTKLELPLPTKILIFMNDIFQNYWWLGLIIAIGIFIMLNRFINTDAGRLKWHYLVLRIPVIGEIISKIKFGQFCNVLGNLIKAGIPILQAIEISGRAAGNDHLMLIFKEIEESVREGTGMAEPMKKYDIIPSIVTQMISAGENSGSVDEMLFKVSDYFNDSADRKIKTLSALIEPLLLVVLGGIVLFLALAIFLPMWDMTKLAKQ